MQPRKERRRNLLELQTRKLLLQAKRNQKNSSAHTVQSEPTLSHTSTDTHTHRVLFCTCLSAFFESRAAWVLFYTTAALLLRFSSPFAEFIDIFSVALCSAFFVRASESANERALPLSSKVRSSALLSHSLVLSCSPSLNTCFFVYNGVPTHSHARVHTRTENNLQFYLIARSRHSLFFSLARELTLALVRLSHAALI